MFQTKLTAHRARKLVLLNLRRHEIEHMGHQNGINILFTNFPKGQHLRFEFLTQKGSPISGRYYKSTNCRTKAKIFQYKICSNIILVNRNKL